MKKLIAIATLLLLTGCAHDEIINGKRIEPYGLLNQEKKDSTVAYEVSPGNVILSIVFSETLVVPVILCGWYLWQPIKK